MSFCGIDSEVWKNNGSMSENSFKMFVDMMTRCIETCFIKIAHGFQNIGAKHFTNIGNIVGQLDAQSEQCIQEVNPINRNYAHAAGLVGATCIIISLQGSIDSCQGRKQA